MVKKFRLSRKKYHGKGLVVSIDRCKTLYNTFTNVSDMRKTIENIKLPTNWILVHNSDDSNSLTFAKMSVDNEVAAVKFSLQLKSNFTWILHYLDKPVTTYSLGPKLC